VVKRIRYRTHPVLAMVLALVPVIEVSAQVVSENEPLQPSPGIEVAAPQDTDEAETGLGQFKHEEEAPAGEDAGKRLLADEFFKEGDYFRAITEYRREEFLSADVLHKAALWRRIGESYLKAKRYNEAIKVFEKLTDGSVPSEVRDTARYWIALTYYESGILPQAEKHLSLCREDLDCSRSVGLDRLTLAEAAFLFEDEKWDESHQALVDFDDRYPGTKFKESAGSIREQVQVGKDLPTKSPVLAGILSAIIPGAGQLYGERYRDGGKAFLLVGALGGLTGGLFYIESKDLNTSWVLPSLVAVVTAVFYGSNIYGAANGARMTNLMTRSRFFHETRPQYHDDLWPDEPDDP